MPSLKLDVVAYQVPDPQGNAPARALWAWCQGMLAAGHDLGVRSWGPQPPERDLPWWCEWRPVPSESALRTRLRALLRPRTDAARVGWSPRAGAISLADDVPSFGAVANVPGSVVTIHHHARADAAALRRWTPRTLQAVRADHHAAHRARLVLAYSGRVAGAARGRRDGNAAVAPVPIAYEMPGAPVPPIHEPVALLLADWRWHPNRVALATLLRLWTDVRARVPAARLVVAGRAGHLLRIGTTAGAGVDVVGPVGRSEDVLGGAAVVAFPCPRTSGPKMKVLEALAHGVPVVTTDAGIEGLAVRPGRGALVAGMPTFAATLAGVLEDPERRATLGASGRADVMAGHSPEAAAEARETAFRAAGLA